MKTKFTIKITQFQVFCNYTLHLTNSGYVWKEEASVMGRKILSAALKLQVKSTMLWKLCSTRDLN